MTYFNHADEIKNFLEISTISNETTEGLQKLQNALYYAAPELHDDFFFYGHRSTRGITSLFQTYEATNDDVYHKYGEMMERYNEFTNQKQK